MNLSHNKEHNMANWDFSASKISFACPICYNVLTGNAASAGLSVGSAPGRSILLCNTCKKNYFGNETHLDLTLYSGQEYGEVVAPITGLFTTRLVSYLYERGWRQKFAYAGFPGPEREFEMAMKYFKPVLGGNIIDASCGSGMFSRLFSKSGLFSIVVAMDFSENMLQECYQFNNKDDSVSKEDLILVRADISRLPFPTSSIDAVNAGAALHCWPSQSSAVAEISRVLRPGGVFVATTVIFDGPFSLFPPFRMLRQGFKRISGGKFFLSESEPEDLCRACGLMDFTLERNGPFVMMAATKPSKQTTGASELDLTALQKS